MTHSIEPAQSDSIHAVIPVLDLMIGQIVLATEGNRDAYRPVHSKLTTSSQPLDVAKSIFNQTGCDWLYLADIDSFSGASPNWNVFNQLLDAGFGLWIDANWISDELCSKISTKIDRTDRLKVILSSETMSTADQFSRFKDLANQNIESIFSLDTKGKTVITQPGELGDASALELIQMACGAGVQNVIVLDLDSVGTQNGIAQSDHPTQRLLEEISQQLPNVQLTSGGGVRHGDDVQTLLDSGCHHVLVASAIHQCKLTPDDVARFIPFNRRVHGSPAR